MSVCVCVCLFQANHILLLDEISAFIHSSLTSRLCQVRSFLKAHSSAHSPLHLLQVLAQDLGHIQIIVASHSEMLLSSPHVSDLISTDTTPPRTIPRLDARSMQVLTAMERTRQRRTRRGSPCCAVFTERVVGGVGVLV